MRIVAVCVFLCLFVSTILTADENVGEQSNIVKRVSSTAVDEVPSSNVLFADEKEQKGKSSKQTFRKFSDKGVDSITNGRDFKFPIILPPYNQEDIKPDSPKPEWGTCLLYIESLSVVVFTSAKDTGSAVAVIDGADGKNTFSFGDGAMSCIAKDDGKTKDPKDFAPKDFWFNIEVDIKEPAKSTKFSEPNNVLFSVEGPLKLLLKLQRKSDYSWYVSDVVANALNVKHGSWLQKDLSVEQGRSSDSANKTMRISGFGDYCYACSSTPAASWKVDDFTVGVSFNNIQLQPQGIWIGDGKEGKKAVRFSRNVNDCVGLFSVGSWMGIVVAIVLLMVLFFGYLMLNSVQTMDRFDDPKQKQLIINAKE